ncbi:MAG TPA: HAD-IIA family hydrolase [Vicinamibacteria bacterium]|nr:HAD-IIA family hydrolase [Vicinamibacteria bacterium]
MPQSVKGLLIDIDGVVLRDENALPGARELVAWLLQIEAKFLFLTNYPSQTPADIAGRMVGAGIAVPANHFFTSAVATAEFLDKQAGDRRRAFVVGEGALVHELYKIGFTMSETEADFVIVGETRHYNFDMIQRAAALIQRGARFIATNPDVAGPAGRPSCGAFCAPIERITGKRPFYVGKPSPFMMRAGMRQLAVHSGEACMIGDNLSTDIIAGVQSGMETVLVLSGVSQKSDLDLVAYRPDHVVKDAFELRSLLETELLFPGSAAPAS